MSRRPGPSFSRQLLDWAAQHGRTGLPWHPPPGHVPDPYRVWLSEIMLQQTQLATMQPYFERFVVRFPDCRALAAAPLDDVLAAWSGLGYYARARNLHRAAQQIVEAGGFPSTSEAWQRLPGVGRSTAAAICAVVFGERVAILDGNVRRVLARQVCAPQPWASPALADHLWREAEARLPEAAQDMPAYTQAIMDLGALVCLPRQPRCQQCPVSAHCESNRQGRVSEFPVPRLARARPVRQARWLVVWRNGCVGLVRQPEEGLWGGLWVLPDWPLDKNWPRGCHAPAALHHDFTHFRLEIQWADLSLSAQSRPPCPGLQWVPLAEALARGLPTPVRRVLGLSRDRVESGSDAEP